MKWRLCSSSDLDKHGWHLLNYSTAIISLELITAVRQSQIDRVYYLIYGNNELGILMPTGLLMLIKIAVMIITLIQADGGVCTRVRRLQGGLLLKASAV